MSVRKINESTLTDIADAIRAKTGGIALINPEDMANEIDGIPTGGGGGGEFVKKTGTFTLNSDYTYADTMASGYNGSLLVDTGLSEVYAVRLWTEEWEQQTMGSDNGVGYYVAFSNSMPSVSGGAYVGNYGSAYGVIKNNASNYFYTDVYGGIVLHEFAPNDVPSGKFGFKCRTSAFPIKAGHTVKWEAIGKD